MPMQYRGLRAVAFVAAFAALAFSGLAGADPPSRVARLGYMAGAVSFSPGGENDWVQATINRPLSIGDRLWTDAGARAEIQVGGAMIRMGARSGLSILNLDDQIAQLQLTEGILNIRVRRLEADQVFEVNTPNLAFTLRQPGEYRIEVDPDDDATMIAVRKGQGEAYGEDAAYVIDARQSYRFTGTGLREYQYADAGRPDDFDRWSSDRDRRYDSSVSARYVSPDVVGYQDLDANGTWRVDATYGNVWVPNRVAIGWAPYRDGHWVWVDPWGWTWVDDAPWGFAVSHYGRWAHLSGTWGWIPGPVRTRAYYAPALVVFVGGDNFQLAIGSGMVGGVAWFPLGPREVYRPSYRVSRGYFENINRSNTVINNTVIHNYYDNVNVTNVVHANRRVPGAVVAVPANAFVQSQSVAKASVRVARDVIAGGSFAVAPPIAPTEQSVRGAAAQRDRPPARTFERPVVARTAPPAAHVGFAAQQQRLSATPGRPLDEAERKGLRPAAAAPTPVVKIVAPPAPSATPREAPPPPRAQSPEQRDRSDERSKGEQRAQPVAPAAPSVETKAAPPAPAAQPPERAGKSDPRERGEPRGQPGAPPQAPRQGAAPPLVAPPVPVARPEPSPRMKSERDRDAPQSERRSSGGESRLSPP
jgi:FecR protein